MNLCTSSEYTTLVRERVSDELGIYQYMMSTPISNLTDNSKTGNVRIGLLWAQKLGGVVLRSKRRFTRRKQLIEAVFNEDCASKPVFLDELRWRVFVREMDEKGTSTAEMPISYMKSFARTLREHMPSLKSFKL